MGWRFKRGLIFLPGLEAITMDIDNLKIRIVFKDVFIIW